jgi:hypothetical protein
MSEFLIYQSENGRTKLDVRLEDETVWLSQKQLTELFGKAKGTISEHLQNIFEEGELAAASVVRKFRITAADGKNYETAHYNLDIIISVGYRVKSLRGTQFRIWATQRLREYIVKGFAMDDERLKQRGGGNYFEELLGRIRDIRSSEKEFWRKVLEIYATSIDYDPSAEASRQFFATVQNKMHWAAHGHTAAEVIHARVDATQPQLGLTHWIGGNTRSPRSPRRRLLEECPVAPVFRQNSSRHTNPQRPPPVNPVYPPFRLKALSAALLLLACAGPVSQYKCCRIMEII